MISVEEALSRILAPLEALPLEQVSTADGIGRVLAEDLAARRTQPPFAVSAMDGYAVRAADLGRIPVSLRIVAEIPAGAGFGGTLGEGEAARIFTGAPLPDGADTIIIQEDTERTGDRVEILSTGDEIVMPGDPIGPHQIVSSNALALAAFVTACGGVPVLVGNAPDDPDALRRIAAAARGVDLFVTTGGVSVGEHDLVRDVLSADGLSIDFWEIAMRPGKPLMFGHYRETPMLGLPGNPVSTLVCSLLFLKPAIDKLSGVREDAEAPATARLGVALKQNDRRQDYLRARLLRAADGVLEAVPFEVQDSSMMRPLAASDCLVMRPPHAPALPAGSPVPIIPFPGGALPL